MDSLYECQSGASQRRCSVTDSAVLWHKFLAGVLVGRAWSGCSSTEPFVPTTLPHGLEGALPQWRRFGGLSLLLFTMWVYYHSLLTNWCVIMDLTSPWWWKGEVAFLWSYTAGLAPDFLLAWQSSPCSSRKVSVFKRDMERALTLLLYFLYPSANILNQWFSTASRTPHLH